MKPMISEFSYGYALTAELAGGLLGPLVCAPIFPSLYDESRPGGGHDLRLPLIGFSLFIQFKLSHFMKRSYSLEWHLFNSEYYRMHLRPLRHSQQHNLLLQLETSGEAVLYASPMFHTIDQLNQAYTSNSVFFSSAFFRPLAIGRLPDDEEHCVVFSSHTPLAYRCSKPEKIEPRISGQDMAGRLSELFKRRGQKINYEYFVETNSRILDTLSKLDIDTSTIQDFKLSRRGQDSDLADAAEFTAYLSRMYFDAEHIIIGHAHQTKKQSKK